jgi:hypothetical protein
MKNISEDKGRSIKDEHIQKKHTISQMEENKKNNNY